MSLQSSIVASNSCLAAPGRYVDIGGTPWKGWTLSGANNIIRGSLMPVQTGTMAVNPMLEAVHYNGGPTLTFWSARGHRRLRGAGQLLNQPGRH